jgi:short-subunit dehydrogenase
MLSTLMKGAALTLAAAQVTGVVLRASRGMRLEGKTALVCGASRGLGRAIALELARRGARVAICARSERELDTVRAEIVALGGTVYAETCDLRDTEQVDALVANVTAGLGPIDVLVPVAAEMLVGPVEIMRVSDFDNAMEAIFKTALNAALAVLPAMRARRSGTIAFITSIGGKISVPHLLPYSAAKFAEVGLAEGLRAESAKDGVHVLTVIPGLMRTGGHVHAVMKGDSEKEYAWFGAGAIAPAPLTISAPRAARRIVRAIERGDRELVLTPAAKLAVRANGIAPSLVSLVLELAGLLLPRAPGSTAAAVRRREGLELEAASATKGVAFVHEHGRTLAMENRQLR